MEGNFRFNIFDKNIISDVFGEEVVLVNLETGIYFSLRASASQIWVRLINNYSVDEIISDIVLLYEVENNDLSIQVRNFIQQLIDNQLIKSSELAEKVSINLNNQGQKTIFTTPILEIFSDMQEILLLDPVHDVDKAGWPVSKSNNSSI
jgi:hypothetical protein